MIGFFATIVSVIILWRLAGQMFGSRWNPGLPWGLIAVLLGVPGLAAIHLFERWFDRRVIARRIWPYLPDVCAGCGYNLTGNTSGTCPECGRAARQVEKAI